MMRKTMKITLAAFAGVLLASGAYAAPVSLSAAQMDSVAAGGVELVDGFVCPVITTDAVLNSPRGIGPLGEGDYSVFGAVVAVPIGATNDDGAGSPGGPYANPGDSTYTAIWEGTP